MIVDGKVISQNIGENIKKVILEKGLTPKLGIMQIGENKASESFINVKKKFGEKYGISVHVFKFDDMDKTEAIEKVLALQQDVDAFILQLPLPDSISGWTEDILRAINPSKDVDNLTGVDFFTSPIILSYQKLAPTFTCAAVVGSGKIVGLAFKKYFEQMGEQFMMIGEDEHENIKKCDLVISGVGKPHVVFGDKIKPKSFLIDYGCSYYNGKLAGDFHPDCYLDSRGYTPVPGGMGPIVVACLFENVLQASLD